MVPQPQPFRPGRLTAARLNEVVGARVANVVGDGRVIRTHRAGDTVSVEADITSLLRLIPKTAGPDPDIITIRNDTGSDLATSQIVGISGQVANTGDDPVYTARVPTAADVGKFAVVLTDIAAGENGKAMLSGVASVQVNVADESHLYADAAEGDVAKLTSVATGSAQIVQKPAGTGLKTALVRLLGPTVAGGSITVRAYKAGTSVLDNVQPTGIYFYPGLAIETVGNFPAGEGYPQWIGIHVQMVGDCDVLPETNAGITIEHCEPNQVPGLPAGGRLVKWTGLDVAAANAGFQTGGLVKHIVFGDNLTGSMQGDTITVHAVAPDPPDPPTPIEYTFNPDHFTTSGDNPVYVSLKSGTGKVVVTAYNTSDGAQASSIADIISLGRGFSAATTTVDGVTTKTVSLELFGDNDVTPGEGHIAVTTLAPTTAQKSGGKQFTFLGELISGRGMDGVYAKHLRFGDPFTLSGPDVANPGLYDIDVGFTLAQDGTPVGNPWVVNDLNFVNAAVYVDSATGKATVEIPVASININGTPGFTRIDFAGDVVLTPSGTTMVVDVTGGGGTSLYISGYSYPASLTSFIGFGDEFKLTNPDPLDPTKVKVELPIVGDGAQPYDENNAGAIEVYRVNTAGASGSGGGWKVRFAGCSVMNDSLVAGAPFTVRKFKVGASLAKIAEWNVTGDTAELRLKDAVANEGKYLRVVNGMLDFDLLRWRSAT